MKLRGIITLLTTLLLGFIVVGGVKAVGQFSEYPATAKMTIAYGMKAGNYAATIDEINKLAKESHITIYKSFVTSKGEVKTAELGGKEANVTELKSYPVVGTYYLSDNPKTFEAAMMADSNLSLVFNNYNLLKLARIILFQSVSSPSLWILFMIFFASIFTVEMTFIKRGMIYRSLGRFARYTARNITFYAGFLAVSTGVSIAIYAVWQGSVDNMFVKLFALTLGISALTLLVLSFLANFLFILVVKVNAMSGILKGRYANRLGSVIYLVSILASIIVISQAASSLMNTASHLSDYKQSLLQWQTVSSYVAPGLLEDPSGHVFGTVNGSMIDHNWLVGQMKKEIAFVQSVPDKDFIYAAPSLINDLFVKVYQIDFKQRASGPHPMVPIQMTIQLTPQILYVSRGFILLNQKLYPKNVYGETNTDKLITLYVPQSSKGKLQAIENNVIAENFGDEPKLNPSQFQVNIVPDNQETFLLNKATPLDEAYLPEQAAQNMILVQINYQKVTSVYPSILEIIGHNTIPYGGGNLLVRQNVLLDKLKAQGLSSNLANMDNVSLDAYLLSQEVTNRLQGSLIIVIGLSLSSVFIVWEYLKHLYQRASKSLTIYNIYRGESRVQELVLLLPLMIGVVLSAAVSGYLTHRLMIFGIILVVYVLEISLVAAINHYQLKQKRIQAVKNSLE